MNVTGLDGKTYRLKLDGHQPLDSDKNHSKGHLRAREVLAGLFPFQVRLEEVPIPGCGKTLYADFFIPRLKILVEVHGRQHYEHVARFHGEKLGFLQQRMCDQKKQQWCNLNDISYVELPDSESDAEWIDRIRRAAFGQTRQDP